MSQGILTNATNFTAAGRPLPAYFQYFGFLQGYLPPGPAARLDPHAQQIAGFYSTTLAAGLVELFCLNSNLGNPREAEPHHAIAAMQREWIESALQVPS